jgi:hypothetical protein
MIGRSTAVDASRSAYARAVNWVTASLALIGTIVGASITLVADRVRWRRDQRQRQVEARRDAYTVFLAALHVTSEGLRAVSLGEGVPETTRPSAARTVFRSANLNAAREQVLLLAQTPVVRAADRTYVALRVLRDVVGQEHDHDSPSYREVLLRYQQELKTLRTTMREDLGTPPLDEDETMS